MKNYTKTIIKVLAFTAAAFFTFVSCSDKNEEVWDKLPDPIVKFIEQYWPGAYASSYDVDDGEYQVRIANGPELDFDMNYNWTDIDGQGMPLPQVLLYDQLPTPLYEYLESGQLTDQVFEMERNNRNYKLELLNQELIYTIATQTVTSVPTTPASPR